MLVIRDAQLAAFRDDAVQRFAQHLLAELADSFPVDFQRLGQAGLLAVVRQGRLQAAVQGWRSEQAVSRPTISKCSTRGPRPRRIVRRGRVSVITIRHEQMAALAAGLRAGFEARMKSRILAEYPDHHGLLGQEGTRKLILKGIADGERYQLGADDSVGILIELMVEFGDNFQRTPDRPWIASMLAQLDVPGEVRIMAVCKRLQTATGGRRMAPPAKSNLL